MVSFCREIFLLCFAAAVLTFFIAGLFFICALSTSITWERTPHPVRRPAFSSHLFSSVMVSLLGLECPAKEAVMRILLTASLCIFAFQATDHSQSTPALSHRIVLPGDIKWQGGGGGLFYADMLGNPDHPGLYVFLNKAQDGMTLPPHWHSRDENVTVLSGTFLVGIGDNFDEHALQAVPAGGYIFIPGNVHHFGKVTGGTGWEIFGEGPFTSDFVNPHDNPSRQTTENTR